MTDHRLLSDCALTVISLLAGNLRCSPVSWLELSSMSVKLSLSEPSWAQDMGRVPAQSQRVIIAVDRYRIG